MMKNILTNPLLQALENSDAFYYIRTDLEGRYSFVNKAFYNKFSHISEDFVGQFTANTVYDDDMDKCNYAADQCILNPDQVQRINVRKPAADGTFFWTDWEFSADFDEAGELSGINCVGYDVTSMVEKQLELQQHAAKLEKAIKQAEDKNEMLLKANGELDTFVYRVSHDLRAPISSALGLIELSMADQDLTTTREYMALQQKTLMKLDSFITDILHYSRNSRQEVLPEELDLEEMIQSICFNFSLSCKSISFHVNITQDVPFWGDKMRLSMILNNLISNAYKFVNPRQEGQFIKVEGHIDEESLQLSISDNGIGIDKQYQDQIFDMFFRATDQKPGSGLGLYIVKEAVDKLGGNIQVNSQLGEGTQFSLSIPNS